MNDRFKFRVIRGKNLFTPTGTVLHFALGNEVGFGKDDVIEQCTGLKDKNGKLIYEGDIVEDMWGDALFIKWRDSEARFAAEDDNVAYDLEDVVDGCNIIGNVHEQAEQKDIK